MEIPDLIREIAKALVDSPDLVKLREVVGEQVTILELEVGPYDAGKVIGKQGRIARSLRVILGATGAKNRRRYSLEILDSRAPAESDGPRWPQDPHAPH